MPQNELLLISSNEKTTYDLAQYDQPTISIGRNPNNDIVVNSPEIDEHQIIIYLESTQYQLIFLSGSGNIALNGHPISESDLYIRKDYYNHDVITFDKYQLVLLSEDENQPNVVDEQVEQPFNDAPLNENGNASDFYSADNVDDYIFISFVTHGNRPNIELEIGEEVVIPVQIHNTGDKVADFEFAIRFSNEQAFAHDWASYVPKEQIVKLIPDQEEQVDVFISLPKEITYQAGKYPFQIQVTSNTYEDRSSQINGTLVVKPFYDFEISRNFNTSFLKNLKLSYFEKNKKLSVWFTNRSNTELTLQLIGKDDKEACNVLFNQQQQLKKQITVDIDYNQTKKIPMVIEPKRRYWFPFQRKTYFFDITANSADIDKQEVISGELKQKSFFGWPVSIFLVLFFLYACMFCSYPRVWTYQFSDKPYTAKTQVIQSNQMVNLKWQIFPPFSNTTINPEFEELSYSGTATAVPTANVAYQLKAENIMSQLIPFPGLFFSTTEDKLQVYVTPVPPNIEFEAYPTILVVGEKADLWWHVTNADELSIRNQTTNAPPEDLSDQMQGGTMRVVPEEDTVYQLEANNKYVATPKVAQIEIKVNTPTPVPPSITTFRIAPSQILEGESVLIQWEAQNADELLILPTNLGSTNLTGSVQDFPMVSQNYQLIAKKEGAPEARSQLIPVIVKQPTATATPTGTASPTATPQAPLIELFASSRSNIILGEKDDDGKDVDTRTTLSWRVIGQPDKLNNITRVQLEGPPDFGPVDVAFPDGELEVTITEERTTFILTAYNGDAQSSETLALGVENATETPTPPPSATPAPTATPTANIVTFYAEYVDSPQDVVSSGTDENGNNKYEVNVRNQDGTNVKLIWRVDNVQTVDISGEQTFNGQPFDGNLIIIVNKRGEYSLQAGDIVPRKVILDVEAVSPPAPTKFRGVYDDDENELNWVYSGGDVENILGFRIYRNNVPEASDFDLVANEDELDQNTRSWTDTDTPTCDRGYYIVAVYYDAEDQKNRETNASSNTSWNSKPCISSTTDDDVIED